MKSYLKGKFLFDLVSLMSLHFRNDQILIFCIRIFYSSNIVAKIKEIFIMYSSIHAVLDLVVLLCKILMFFHFNACIILFLGNSKTLLGY